jgi:23S rRNA (adenine2503-C2)-methyltransferase
MQRAKKPDFFGRTIAELKVLLREELGVSQKFRADQVYMWLYGKRVTSFSEMTDLPRSLQQSLSEHFSIPQLECRHVSESADGTKKFLFGLEDGRSIETVLIPSEMRDARGESRRKTLCISTQVGCALDCKFCATASLKLKRNLTTAEILLQIFEVERITGDRITNLVYMGMGEPLLNYENVVRSLRIITDSNLDMLGKRRITVSTSGIAPAIRGFAGEGLNVKLALSLHATTDALRTRLMPINKKYPLEEVLQGMEDYYQSTRTPVTYEYILFKGLNDTEADAKRLAKIARRVPSKVNVIPFHTIEFTHPEGIAAALQPAPKSEFDRFISLLKEQGVAVMVRSSSGQDIEAACGQLALAEQTLHEIALPTVS